MTKSGADKSMIHTHTLILRKAISIPPTLERERERMSGWFIQRHAVAQGDSVCL